MARRATRGGAPRQDAVVFNAETTRDEQIKVFIRVRWGKQIPNTMNGRIYIFKEEEEEQEAPRWSKEQSEPEYRGSQQKFFELQFGIVYYLSSYSGQSRLHIYSTKK